MSNNTIRTETRQRVLTRQDVEQAIGQGIFSLEEELVLRMQHGVGLAPEAALTFRGQDNEELKVKLAMMEQSILEELEAEHDPKDLLSRI